MKTIVIGLGNPILGDDGVGWQIAAELQKTKHLPPGVTVESMAIGGISLMEALIDYDRAIIVDSIVSHQAPMGEVRLYALKDLPNPGAGHTSSAHDTSLAEALQMGHSLGAHLPEDISIVTVESHRVYDFSEELSNEVAAAIPEALRIILDLLIESRTENTRKPKDLKN